MSKKKSQFDLTRLVKDGSITEGETFSFVSDPKKTFTVQKQPNGDFKIHTEDGVTTVHAFAMKCLGQEPPMHAAQWFKNTKGQTLYEIWHANDNLDQFAA